MKKQITNFHVIYRKDVDDMYIATVPALPGCQTQGKTIEQAESRIKEAMECYLESVKKDKQLRSTYTGSIFVGSVAVHHV